jgi:methylated-DNA-protein-cysteine methyltransferase-like protein
MPMKDQKSVLSGGLYQRIYNTVQLVPRGKVTTYGYIALIVGKCTPRMVGYAMAAIPFGSNVPWQRVINAKGEISLRKGGDGAEHQKFLLEQEGVRFNNRGKIDLSIYGWTGPGRKH